MSIQSFVSATSPHGRTPRMLTLSGFYMGSKVQIRALTPELHVLSAQCGHLLSTET